MKLKGFFFCSFEFVNVCAYVLATHLPSRYSPKVLHEKLPSIKYKKVSSYFHENFLNCRAICFRKCHVFYAVASFQLYKNLSVLFMIYSGCCLFYSFLLCHGKRTSAQRKFTKNTHSLYRK